MEMRNPKFNRAGTIDAEVLHHDLGWISATLVEGPIYDVALAMDPMPYAPPEPTPIDPKIVGVQFDGVMCSATAADQAGLAAVLLAIQIQGAAFQPTRFQFENGNSLVISLANYQEFMGVWMPFRQSFFVVLP